MGELAFEPTEKQFTFHPLIKGFAAGFVGKGPYLHAPEAVIDEFFHGIAQLELEKRREVTGQLLLYAKRLADRIGRPSAQVCETIIDMVTEVSDDMREAVSMFEDEDTEIIHISDLRADKPQA